LRVVEFGGAGDCLFLVFALFMLLSISASQAEHRVLADNPLVHLRQYSFTSEAKSLLKIRSLSTIPLTLPDLQESGADVPDGVHTIMRWSIKDSGISIKTHFASPIKTTASTSLLTWVSAPQTPTANWKIKPLYGTLETSLKGTGSHWSLWITKTIFGGEPNMNPDCT
jgi:hypothetical protein